MQELNKALSITTKLLTSFHLQTDRQTEIVNKEIGKFLWIYCFEKQDSWFAWLPITQFSINTKKHALTKKSPFDVTRSYLHQLGQGPSGSEVRSRNGKCNRKCQRKYETGTRLNEGQHQQKLLTSAQVHHRPASLAIHRKPMFDMCFMQAI